MKPLRIFSDRHHSGLAYSLHLTLVERLGHELYFPIGMEWADEYWKIHKPYGYNLDTARQFLDERGYIPKDGTPLLNDVVAVKPTHYEVNEDVHGYILKALTLEQFKQMDIDIIIASVPDHFDSFRALRDRYKPNARLVCHIGNIFWHNDLDRYHIKNLMASVAPFQTNILNAIFYHQEMKVVPYQEPPTTSIIRSFVNLLPEPHVFEQYKQALQSVAMCEAYGAGTPCGMIAGIDKLYQKIQNSSIIFHFKPRGDGFGHLIFSYFMLGRPVITNFNDYTEKLAGKLLIEGVTAIDMGKRPLSETTTLIGQILGDRERLRNMCQASYNIFRDTIDYRKDAVNIQQFLERSG